MIEGRFLGRGIRVDQNEFVPALYRLPVPQQIGPFNPSHRSRNIEGETLEPGAKFAGALIIGGGDLTGKMGRREDEADKQSRVSREVFHTCLEYYPPVPAR